MAFCDGGEVVGVGGCGEFRGVSGGLGLAEEGVVEGAVGLDF